MDYCPNMQPFWQYTPEELFSGLQSSIEGLSEEEIKRRLAVYGPNSLKPPQKGRGWLLFFSQFKSPLILILIVVGSIELRPRE